MWKNRKFYILNKKLTAVYLRRKHMFNSLFYFYYSPFLILTSMWLKFITEELADGLSLNTLGDSVAKHHSSEFALLRFTMATNTLSFNACIVSIGKLLPHFTLGLLNSSITPHTQPIPHDKPEKSLWQWTRHAKYHFLYREKYINAI